MITEEWNLKYKEHFFEVADSTPSSSEDGSQNFMISLYKKQMKSTSKRSTDELGKYLSSPVEEIEMLPKPIGN